MLTHLHLHTTQPQRLQHFYADTLGFHTTSTTNGFEVQVGHTRVEWSAAGAATPYHFAVNIPSNQVQGALSWLADRVSILPYQGHDIVDFSAWNAEAMYFYDPDHNIVEFIARHNTQPNAEGPFQVRQCLGVSEIGLPTDDVPSLTQYLLDDLGLPLYSGNRTQFAAIGDEEALLIVVDQDRPWLPNNDDARPAPFTATLQQGPRTHHIQYPSTTHPSTTM